jgi:hypothetical protein
MIICFAFIVIIELCWGIKTVPYLCARIEAWYEYKEILLLPFSQLAEHV